MRAGRPARGFTLVWVLMALALLSVGLAAMGTVWSADAQREREQELLRVGALYAQAVQSYYRASPGTLKRLPPSIDALLLDTRFGVPVRHLRRPYADPLAPSRPWGELRAADGGLRGVFSQSKDKPLRDQAMDLGMLRLAPAAQYSDWHFVAQVQQ